MQYIGFCNKTFSFSLVNLWLEITYFLILLDLYTKILLDQIFNQYYFLYPIWFSYLNNIYTYFSSGSWILSNCVLNNNVQMNSDSYNILIFQFQFILYRILSDYCFLFSFRSNIFFSISFFFCTFETVQYLSIYFGHSSIICTSSICFWI
jgi:hypothetical protein